MLVQISTEGSYQSHLASISREINQKWEAFEKKKHRPKPVAH